MPIHPHLAPLLAGMAKGRAPDEKVLPFLETTGHYGGRRHGATGRDFCDHLRAAGVTHPRLFEDTSERRPVGFRSLRDTGITWAAIAGEPLTKIQRRAGHDDPKVTDGYIKAAEDFSALVVEVFPPLPLDLVGQDPGPEVRVSAENPRRAQKPTCTPASGPSDSWNALPKAAFTRAPPMRATFGVMA